MESSTRPPALNVAIVGAGIAGLCAGIALKRSNSANAVTLYEKSTFKHEIGAAITLTPNANRILDRWGFVGRAHGETDKLQFRSLHAQTLELMHHEDFSHVKEEYGHNFNAYHRVDLHRGLRTMLEDLGAEIKLAREVVGLECAEGVLTFKDGTEAKHDLVVVADGIRSTLVKTITGLNVEPKKIGKSVFRGLIPMQALRDDPLIWQHFEGQPSGFCSTMHEGTMVMLYPCANDTVMNAAIFHTTRPGHEEDEGWTCPATKAEVLSVLQDVHPVWRAIVAAAPSDDNFKCFAIKFRDTIPRFNNGRCILVGDAAHPFMPTHGQGGCMSIEDAASLGTLFRNTTSASTDVAQRCQIYNDFRIPRDNTTQLYSNVMFYHTNGVFDGDQHAARLKEFYSGPLMPMNVKAWSRAHQQFWYSYDVDREAEKAVEWYEKGSAEQGARPLPSGVVRHFY